MFIKNLMLSKEELITVAPDSSIGFALKLINKNDFLSIPVVTEGKFFGSISKEKILSFYYESCNDLQCVMNLEEHKVEEIMTKNLPTVTGNNQIELAAHLLGSNKKAAFVAVLDEAGDFIGILTHNAIFKEFEELFGFNKGKRLAVIAYDEPGQIAKLTKIITDNGADIISCVVADPKSKFEVKEIVLRIRTENYEDIAYKVSNSGYKVQ